MAGKAAPAKGSRTRARRLAMQAIYQHQINPQDWRDIYKQIARSESAKGADLPYFKALLRDVTASSEALAVELDTVLDRPFVQLDPVERAILLVGVFELREQPDVPYRVVINEAVELARRYGATGGHRYINGVLDQCATRLRGAEAAAPAKATQPGK